MDVAAFNDFAAQLALLTSATAVNVSMSREKYDMVVTSCNRDDMRQSKNGCVSKLRFCLIYKPKESVRDLQCEVKL